MYSLEDIQIWKIKFGYLPIHLEPVKDNHSFILLNGGSNDFCLNYGAENPNSENFKSLAWSSNTKHFVIFKEDFVYVHNWNNDRIEQVSYKKVKDKLDKFHDYLVVNNYRTSNDVIPFVIELFKMIRNKTQEKKDSVEALNLLFVLLSSLEDNIENFDFNKWGLQEIIIPKDFEKYSVKLKSGVNNITPNLELILRHSAGRLFQEAQKEVSMFDTQMDLWGFPSSKNFTKKSFLSSIHFTPYYVSRFLVENALEQTGLEKDELKIFDPACGSGEFLTETLKQLTEKNYKGKVKIIGWDSVETAINTTRYLLNYEKRLIWKDRLSIDIKLVSDSLAEDWDNDYDLILMNPPFVSWEHLKKNERDVLISVLGKSNKIGKPNQAAGFLIKSIENIGQKGTIGSVMPSSFLTLDSYSELRRFILDVTQLKLIGKLGNYVFEGPLTDVSLVLLKKETGNQYPLLIHTQNEKNVARKALMELRKMKANNSVKSENEMFSIYYSDSFPITKESWRPLSLKELELLKSLKVLKKEKNLIPVIDIFNVSQGIRTGHKIFVLNEKQYYELPEPEQQYFKPAVNKDSIKNCQLIQKYFVWYPYNEKEIIIKSEKELINSVPIYFKEYLNKNRNSLIERARINESNWWHLSEHRAWLRKKEPRLYSGEFGSSKSFAFDKEGKFTVVRGNAWLPKKVFTSNEYYYFYLAVFSSGIFDKLLSIYSRGLLQGWDLGKKYTKEILIPNIFLDDIKTTDEYERLVELGEALSNGFIHVRSSIDEVLSRSFYIQ